MDVMVKLDDVSVQYLFRQLIDRGTKMQPLMQDIGEFLAESTKQRFQTSTAPDGSRWLPNAPATYVAYLSKFKSFGKTGRINASGAGRAIGKKPLIGETGNLSRQINYRADETSVEVGSAQVYSAIQNFGGQAGRNKSVTIPARPFLGLSGDDVARIRDLAGSYLVAP